jgi:hypothetical protein
MTTPKPFMKRLPQFLANAPYGLMLLFVSTAALTTPAHGQDATSAILTAAGGAGGFAIGNQYKDQWGAAPYVGAAVLPVLANWGYGIFKNKSDEDKIKYYISGRNYERWIQSQSVWYQSTLDPYTGRPPAFSGLNAMNDGMPKQDPNAQSGENSKITKVYTIPVKVPAGTYDGTPYTERITEFPKLP